MDEQDQIIFDNIEKYGCHIIHVLAVDNLPNFSYSIGLFETYQKPEIIIIGLKQNIQQVLLNNIAYDYKEGRVLESGKMHGDILDDYECLLLDVEKKHYDEYVGQAIDYYKEKKFPLIQIIWPTPSNMYPFDKDAPDGFKKWQPVLGKYKKN